MRKPDWQTARAVARLQQQASEHQLREEAKQAARQEERETRRTKERSDG